VDVCVDRTWPISRLIQQGSNVLESTILVLSQV